MSELADLLGERIKAIRKKMKLSRAEFAHIVGMSEDAIGLIERGETTPRLESLYKISSKLKLPLAKLLELKKKSVTQDSKSKKKNLASLNSYLNTKSASEIQMVHDIARNVFSKKRAPKSILRDK